MPEFSCIAFVPVYNDWDIGYHVACHLVAQGIEPYIIDNWGEDNLDFASNALLDFAGEHFPASGPVATYNWTDILRRIETLSRECGATWSMLVDADEVRRSRRPGETLLQALQRFDRDGATAAGFEVYNFWPTEDTWDGTQNPEKHFRYYEQASYRLPHVKAWKNNGQVLTLAATGGHVATATAGLPGGAHPESLILKHYPIRSAAQAARKLDQDRFPRWSPAERARRWHVQYDELVRTRQFIRDPKTLTEWRDA